MRACPLSCHLTYLNTVFSDLRTDISCFSTRRSCSTLDMFSNRGPSGKRSFFAAHFSARTGSSFLSHACLQTMSSIAWSIVWAANISKWKAPPSIYSVWRNWRLSQFVLKDRRWYSIMLFWIGLPKIAHPCQSSWICLPATRHLEYHKHSCHPFAPEKTQVPISAPQYLQAQKVYHKHSTKILRSVSSMLPNEKMQHQKFSALREKQTLACCFDHRLAKTGSLTVLSSISHEYMRYHICSWHRSPR